MKAKYAHLWKDSAIWKSKHIYLYKNGFWYKQPQKPNFIGLTGGNFISLSWLSDTRLISKMGMMEAILQQLTAHAIPHINFQYKLSI